MPHKQQQKQQQHATAQDVGGGGGMAQPMAKSPQWHHDVAAENAADSTALKTKKRLRLGSDSVKKRIYQVNDPYRSSFVCGV